MSTVEGGLRDRFVEHALYNVVRDTLEDLGWMATNRQHVPVTLIARELGAGDEVQLTTVNIIRATLGSEDIELGSTLAENRYVHWIDVYGESDAIAQNVAGDLRASLLGKMGSIGREAAVIEVFDYRDGDPEIDSLMLDPIFVLDVDRVVLEHAHSTTRPWEKFWYSLQVELLDEH